MKVKKATSRKLAEARDAVIRKLLKNVKRYEEYESNPEDETFGHRVKLLELIKRETMVVNQLGGISAAEKEREARAGLMPDGLQEDEATLIQERFEEAQQELEKLGLKGIN